MRRVAPVVALLAAGAAAGSEPERFGFGMRSPAMAGTGAATADDYEATYANPAGLGWAGHRRLTVGYVLGRYAVALDGAARPIEDTNGLVLGADLPLPLGGPLAGKVALGLGFYLPTGLINRARAPFPGTASLPLLDSPTQTVSLTVSAAIRLTDRLGIGAGVLALAALVGSIQLATDAGGRVVSHAEQQLVTDFAPVAGVRFDPGARWRLALVFRGVSQSRYDIRIGSDLGNAVPLPLPTLRISGVSQYDPLQLAAEAAFAPGRGVLLAAQLTYKRWSDFPQPVDNATVGAPPIGPTGYHDTVVPRAAIEWRRAWPAVALALRGGYFFEWSPAPARPWLNWPLHAPRPESALLDADRHVLSVGGELHLVNRHAPVHLELFFQWHQLVPNPRVSGFFGVAGASLGVEL